MAESNQKKIIHIYVDTDSESESHSSNDATLTAEKLGGKRFTRFQ